jgi:hypothetical protein
LISSCGKKGEGSNPGVSPLFPAPVSIEMDKLDTDEVMLSMLSEVGIRIEQNSNLDNSPAVIICVNTEFTHEEKIEGLKNYFITINNEEVSTRMPKNLLNALIPKAVEALSAAPLDSKRCPKIYLAIE